MYLLGSNASYFMSSLNEPMMPQILCPPLFLQKETSDDIFSYIEVNNTIIAGFVNVLRPHYPLHQGYWCSCLSSTIFLLASQSEHCTAAPPPPGSEEQCLSEALTTVFSMLHQALRVYYSCGRADKTAYKIITKMIGGAGGQSCTDGCRKPILVGLM